MANKEVIIFKAKANRNITNSKYTFRAIVRYSIIFTLTTLIAYLLFSLDGLHHVTNDFETYALNNASKFIAIFLLVLIGIMAIKMNQSSFNGSLVDVVMVILSLGYAGFIAVFFSDYQVDHFEQLEYMWNFTWPILAFLIFWYLISSYLERRTRPQLSKYMIWRAAGATIILAFLWLVYLYLYKFTSIIKAEHDSFDRENPLHLFLVVSTGLLFLLEVAQIILRFKIYKRAMNKEDILKSISLAILFMVTLPMAAWFIYNYIVLPKTTEEYLFIIADVFIILFGVLATLLKKGRASSPVITTTIYSICTVMIWINKFAFDSFKVMDSRQEWEISVSLITMSIIVILMFVKNNPTSLTQSISQIIFTVLMSAFILGDSVINAFPISRDTINLHLKQWVGMSWDEALNIILLTSSVGLVLTATTDWYKVQAKINHNLSVKLRKGGKHA